MKYLLLAVTLIATINAALAQDKEVEFTTFQLSDTVYMLTGSGGNVGVSTGEDGLYIIDDQVRPVTTQLLQAIRKISDQPIRFVINTHYHGDHTGGNEAIGKTGAVIIAHDNIRKRMSTDQVSIFRGKTTPAYAESALPVVTFNDRMSLHFNGETATAYYVANGHTDGDSIIHFPVSNVIHMGDMFFNGLYPYVDLDAGGAVQGMISASNLALSMADDSTRIIPGHGPVANKADLKSALEMLVDAEARVRTLVDAGMTEEQILEKNPLEVYHEQWNWGFITTERMTKTLYRSLTDG